MPGDIVLAGFVLTAEEWQALDPTARAQLVAAACKRDDLWTPPVAPRVFPEGTGSFAKIGE
jgi:hypothetical protein